MRKLLLCSIIFVIGCRQVLGESAYEYQEDFDFTGDDGGLTDPEFLPGPDPYESGERRLSLGMFYEGGFSDQFPVDNVVGFFYIYEDSVHVDLSEERVEGIAGQRIALTGAAWWGCGIHWDSGRDLSSWTRMYLSARSADPALSTFQVSMNDGETVSLEATDYGFVNDDSWHHLMIPLSDFVSAGLDLTNIEAPFILLGGAGASGESVLIDNLYLTNEE